jgi:hypothetical protein
MELLEIGMLGSAPEPQGGSRRLPIPDAPRGDGFPDGDASEEKRNGRRIPESPTERADRRRIEALRAFRRWARRAGDSDAADLAERLIQSALARQAG